MDESSAPTKFPAIWAYDATNPTYVRAVPTTPTSQNGAASLQFGFPPATFEPDTSGGAGPYGEDANGILQQVTAGLQWQQAGGALPFDPTFATDIGGYPEYAFVRSITLPGSWISTEDANSNDPDTGGADWLPVVQLSSSLRAGASTPTYYTYSGNNPNGFVQGTASAGAVGPDFCYTQGGSQGLWVCVSSGPASGAGQAVWVQIWNGAGPGPTLPTVANGQCRFAYTNGTTSTLSPYGGGGLIVNGVLQVIPSPAPTIAASACSAGPNYIYAAISGGGSMVLEASTTAYTINSSGLPNKTGDATRTLVGWAYVAGGVFVQSLVASWYNRRTIPLQSNPAFVNANFDSAGLSDLGSGCHIQFFIWGDEGFLAQNAGGSVNTDPAGIPFSLALAVDGSVVNETSAPPGGIPGGYTIFAALPGAYAEGLHTLAIYGNTAGAGAISVYAMCSVSTNG